MILGILPMNSKGGSDFHCQMLLDLYMSSSPSSWAHRWIPPCLGEPRVVGFRGTLGDYFVGGGRENLSLCF